MEDLSKINFVHIVGHAGSFVLTGDLRLQNKQSVGYGCWTTDTTVGFKSNGDSLKLLLEEYASTKPPP